MDSKKKQDAKTQLALLKEILYDDEQLKSLIHKSDSTLKTVQDFFTLDNSNLTNKKQVKINMTLAPNITDLNESILPHNSTNNNRAKKQTILTAAKINNANSFDLTDLNESDLIDDEDLEGI